MAQPAKETVVFSDFLGLATNQNTQQTGAGLAQDQSNTAIIRLNELVTRQGVWELAFED